MFEIYFENQHNRKKELEQKYKKRINEINNMEISEEEKQQKKYKLKQSANSYLKEIENLPAIHFGEYNMDIYIPHQIYINHKKEIDDICKYYEKNLEGSGYNLRKTLSGVDTVIGRMKIIYNVKTF